MNKNLRLTGENPSPEHLEQYPNWECALNEEDVDGQDETTLRPAEDQSVIGKHVPFTAGTAWLNNGLACSAIIELNDDVAGIQLLLHGKWCRIIRRTDRFRQFLRWEPFGEDWLPKDERSPSLALTDENLFPLTFASRLPHYRTSLSIRARILPNGGEETWS